jgi:hypothetical protein
MPLQHPEPPSAVTDLVTGKLRHVGERAPDGPAALGGAAPASLTPTDPHEVYVLSITDLLNDDNPLESAGRAGWRYLLTDGEQAVAAAMTTRTEAGEDRFALFNSGPYVGGTVTALQEAAALPQAEAADLQVRMLTVPALNLTTVWLHGDDEDLLVPLAPAPAQATAGTPYPANELLAALREPAQALADIGPADQTGG